MANVVKHLLWLKTCESSCQLFRSYMFSVCVNAHQSFTSVLECFNFQDITWDHQNSWCDVAILCSNKTFIMYIYQLFRKGVLCLFVKCGHQQSFLSWQEIVSDAIEDRVEYSLCNTEFAVWASTGTYTVCSFWTIDSLCTWLMYQLMVAVNKCRIII